jgi:Na+/melibiose symporter-like transporter
MSAEIAKDYKRAGVLWGYGMFFSMLGTNAMGTSLTAALVIWYGRDAHAYNAMSLTMAAIIILIGVSCVVGTAKAPRVSAQALKRAERPPVREWISSLVSSRSLMAYVVSETICYFATAMLAVTMTYYLFTIVRLGQVGMFTYGMTGLVGSVIGMVVVLRLMKWIPKHILSACSAIGSGCVVLGLGLLTDKSGLIPFGALVFVWGIFTLGRTLMSNALVPDLIHADFLKTGLRREGAIASITSAIQKTAPAVVTAVFSFLLAASGYIPGHPGGQQPQSAVHMIMLMNCYIPGVMLILSSLVLFFAYTLTEQRLKQIEAEADARRVAEL